MKLRNLTLVLSATALLASCKLKLDQIKYTVTPNPLELHGDSIEVTVSGEYPKKTMPKKFTAEVTPVLEYNGGSKDLKTLYLKGEKSDAKGETVKHAGGTFKYKDKIAYVPGMEEAYLHAKGTGKNKKGKVKYEGKTKEPIATGTIITPLLLQKDEKTVYGKNQYGPIILTQTGTAYFTLAKYNLRQSEKDTLTKGSFNSFVDFQMKDGGTFQSLSIDGYASPEGDESRNADLSSKRGEEVKKYVDNYLKGKKLNLSATSKGNGEDKATFNALIQSSNVDNKQEVISKVNSGAFNKDFKALGAQTYNELEKNVFGKIRRATVTLKVQERQKTNDELVNLAKTNTKALTLEEILHTTETLISDDATNLSILEKAAKGEYKDYSAEKGLDWRPNNNIGCIYVKQGKLNEALTEFQKAEKIDGSEKAIKNNIGVIYAMKGDRANALKQFTAAKGAGKEVDHNMGNYYVQVGKYSDAVSSYGDDCSINAALAKVLNKNPEKAASTIDCGAEKDKALAYYVKAIAAARSNNTSEAINNLKTAIQKDGSFKARAKKDLEFRNLFENSEFKSVVN